MLSNQGTSDINHKRYNVVLRTLSFISNKGKILLMKGSNTKKLWPCLYNGVGGHVEAYETIKSSALREIYEETGLHSEQLTDFILRGIVNITPSNQGRGVMLFVFTGKTEVQEVVSSKEGDLSWLNWRDIGLQEMVVDLPVLLSKIESYKKPRPFYARYSYDDYNKLHIDFD